MIKLADVKITIHRPQKGSPNLLEMRLDHMPTGKFVKGQGKGAIRLKNKLLKELEKKIG